MKNKVHVDIREKYNNDLLTHLLETQQNTFFFLFVFYSFFFSPTGKCLEIATKNNNNNNKLIH